MAKKKTNKLILIAVVLLSVFSFIFTNVEACNTMNNPEYTYELEMEDNDDHSTLLPEIYFVKEFIGKALDVLGSNF